MIRYIEKAFKRGGKMEGYIIYLLILIFSTITVWLTCITRIRCRKTTINSSIIWRFIESISESSSLEAVRFRLGEKKRINLFQNIKQTLKKKYENVSYVGEITIPEKAITRDNINIKIEFTRVLYDILCASEKLISRAYQLAFRTDYRQIDPKYLSVEMQCADIEIDGEKVQDHLVGDEPLIFHWNASITHPGYYSPNFIFRIKEDKIKKEIGAVSFGIKVYSIWGLSRLQLNIIKFITGLIALILTTLKVLQTLGVL
jgi:hypothetical protein